MRTGSILLIIYLSLVTLIVNCADIQTIIRTEDIHLPDAQEIIPKTSEWKTDMHVDWTNEYLLDIDSKTYRKCWNEVIDTYRVQKITERKIIDRRRYITNLAIYGAAWSAICVGTSIRQKSPIYLLGILPLPTIGIVNSLRATDSRQELPPKKSTYQMDVVERCHEKPFDGVCAIEMGGDRYQANLQEGKAKMNVKAPISKFVNLLSSQPPEEAEKMLKNTPMITINCNNEISKLNLNYYVKKELETKVGELYFKRGNFKEQKYSDLSGALKDYVRAKSFGYPNIQYYIDKIKEPTILNAKTWLEAFDIALGSERYDYDRCIDDTKEGLAVNTDYVCLSAKVYQVVSENSFLAHTDLLWVEEYSYNAQDFWGTIVNEKMQIFEGPYFFIAKYKGRKNYTTVLGARKIIPEYNIYYIKKNDLK